MLKYKCVMAMGQNTITNTNTNNLFSYHSEKGEMKSYFCQFEESHNFIYSEAGLIDTGTGICQGEVFFLNGQGSDCHKKIGALLFVHRYKRSGTSTMHL